MMTGFNVSSILVILIVLVFAFSLQTIEANPLVELSGREEMVELAGYGEEKLSTVLVTGTIICEACLDGQQYRSPSPVSGASVVVVCNPNRKTKRSVSTLGVTDEYGDFIIDLPSHLHANPSLDKACLLNVHQLPKASLCRPNFIRKHKEIRLSSFGNGIRTYTTGRISLHRFSPKSSRPCIKKRKTKEENSW